ncbi:hypothetical protein N658DRAFT_569125, partial [Parathielavia hyrcaniae]
MVMRRQSSMMAIRPSCWCRQVLGLGGASASNETTGWRWLGGWRKHLWHRTLLPFFSTSLRACHPQWQTKPRSTIIEDNSIGNGLDTFRSSFSTVFTNKTISRVPDALGQLDQE